MVRTRPFEGSTATTLPFIVPSAATAATRTARSSPSTKSPIVGSTGGPGRRTTFFAGAFLLPPATARAGKRLIAVPLAEFGEERPFLVCAAIKPLYETRPARA